MKILVTGGTGFVGTSLAGGLIREGHKVTVLTRTARADHARLDGPSYLIGNPSEEGEWQQRVAEHEVIINLAGASIFTRWTQSAKKSIRESRTLTTQHLVQALSKKGGRVKHLLSTSAVGYYGFRKDEDLDEQSPPGEGFLASLSREWESAALEAESFGVTVTLLRFGVVLGRDGGALKQMIPLFKYWLGSPLGTGKQWFSWIHEEDLVRIFLYLLSQKIASGPFNCTSPEPVRNEKMTEMLGQVLGKPTFMPAVPEFVIRIILGEFGTVLVKGQKAMPRRLLDLGFQFRFPEIRGALEDLLKPSGLPL
jgi:uncharacterized protein (TIGR01777 family)